MSSTSRPSYVQAFIARILIKRKKRMTNACPRNKYIIPQTALLETKRAFAGTVQVMIICSEERHYRNMRRAFVLKLSSPTGESATSSTVVFENIQFRFPCAT
eukprot:6206635-Pleurochrysis_carterae.AAC.2